VLAIYDFIFDNFPSLSEQPNSAYVIRFIFPDKQS
jgi:hypothetical protein